MLQERGRGQQCSPTSYEAALSLRRSRFFTVSGLGGRRQEGRLTYLLSWSRRRRLERLGIVVRKQIDQEEGILNFPNSRRRRLRWSRVAALLRETLLPAK